MFGIPNHDKHNLTNMNAAKGQIQTSLGKSRLALFLSGAVLAGGAVAVLNGVGNAQYVSLLAEVGANIPEAAVSLAGGAGVVSHAIYNARLKKARKELNYDIAVEEEVQRRMHP